MSKRLAIGITGASGVAYGRRLLQRLAGLGEVEVDLVISPAAHAVFRDEAGLEIGSEPYDLQALITPGSYPAIRQFGFLNLGAPPASGSNPYDGYIICPCSAGSLGKIAAGLCDSLITRMADVALKERRPLILVPRETPLSTIHLSNMLQLSEAGTMILPAAPGFYKATSTVEDLLDFIVNRIFLHLGLPVSSSSRWEGSEAILTERQGKVVD